MVTVQCASAAVRQAVAVGMALAWRCAWLWTALAVTYPRLVWTTSLVCAGSPATAYTCFYTSLCNAGIAADAWRNGRTLLGVRGDGVITATRLPSTHACSNVWRSWYIAALSFIQATFTACFGSARVSRGLGSSNVTGICLRSLTADDWRGERCACWAAGDIALAERGRTGRVSPRAGRLRCGVLRRTFKDISRWARRFLRGRTFFPTTPAIVHTYDVKLAGRFSLCA